MTQLSVADVLERAADLIEPEGAWTQEAFSRNADGIADRDEDETAAEKPVCWCALGALAEVAGVDVLSPYALSLPAPKVAAYPMLRALIGEDVADWNDRPWRTQTEVVAKLREAAALARQQESTSC